MVRCGILESMNDNAGTALQAGKTVLYPEFGSIPVRTKSLLPP